MNHPVITRTVELLDYEIKRDGDGRTVVAYAATFGNGYEVNDHDGHYDEVINAKAFNQTIKRGAVRTAQVHFNHGLTLWGTPSDKWTEPVGVPLDISADSRGLLTTTRYGRTPAAEEVLQMWHDGMIRGQSFRGSTIRSARPKPGPNARPIIERLELGLREYGPTPNPANIEAGLVAVRSQLLAQVGELTPEERRELAALLAETPALGDDPRDPAPVDPSTQVEPDTAPGAEPSIDLLELANANRRRQTP